MPTRDRRWRLAARDGHPACWGGCRHRCAPCARRSGSAWPRPRNTAQYLARAGGHPELTARRFWCMIRRLRACGITQARPDVSGAMRWVVCVYVGVRRERSQVAVLNTVWRVSFRGSSRTHAQYYEMTPHFLHCHPPHVPRGPHNYPYIHHGVQTRPVIAAPLTVKRPPRVSAGARARQLGAGFSLHGGCKGCSDDLMAAAARGGRESEVSRATTFAYRVQTALGRFLSGLGAGEGGAVCVVFTYALITDAETQP